MQRFPLVECNQPRPGDRCPHLSCTCLNETAACKGGKCTVEEEDC